MGCDAVGWQGWSREFGQHAARLRNGLRLQAQTRPARETTLRANAREEEQRSQRAAARPNRVRSALTQSVKVVVENKVHVHAVYPAEESGQLPFLGSLFREGPFDHEVARP